jgi:hypothetical protein
LRAPVAAYPREDRVLIRSVEACPMAEELFQVCSIMDQWFNLGDGQMLLRAAGEATGTRLRSGVLPGLSRKVVALTREPGHLLQNFAAYALGAHGRLAHKRAGKSGPSVGMIVEGGRRLTSLNFVSFAGLFSDIMARAIAPWALAVQCASSEPWVTQRRYERSRTCLEDLLSSLRSLRGLLRVLVLLRQYLVPSELRPFVEACFFCSPGQLFVGAPTGRDQVWGRRLPVFLAALNDFLHAPGDTPLFHKVELLSVPPRSPDEWVCLGAHCQCAFLLARRRARSSASALKKKQRATTAMFGASGGG